MKETHTTKQRAVYNTRIDAPDGVTLRDLLTITSSSSVREAVLENRPEEEQRENKRRKLDVTAASSSPASSSSARSFEGVEVNGEGDVSYAEIKAFGDKSAASSR